jgi:hypothetical protein
MFSADTELVARLTTVVQTLLVAIVVYAFGRRFFGWLAGTAAVLLFAVNRSCASTESPDCVIRCSPG